MGDRIGDEVAGRLAYVPRETFERVLGLEATASERVALFASLCRINTLYMIARAGSGHLGSSFSSLDIVSWLLLEELADDDVYFSSKGHDVPGLYSAWIGLGRLPFDLLHRLRRAGGLPGHPDIGVPGVAANTGSLGMGVSKAKGMVLADRMLGRTRRVFVMTGDGELQEGQFWESLPLAANRRMHEITVLIDHNKLQSDTFVRDVSDLGDLERKLSAFGWGVGRCDGHDVESLARALAAPIDGPRAIICDTVKGKGVSFMEHTSMGNDVEFYKFHSGAPSVEQYESALRELVYSTDAELNRLGDAPVDLKTIDVPSPPDVPVVQQRLVSAYGRALVDHAARDGRIVAFDADLLLDTALDGFRELFPERFVECGIAEQDMVTMAGAVARQGMLPFVHSFASFLSARPNEQVFNNATERARVVYVGSLAGVLPGGPGHSHQGVRDIASLSGVPGLVLLEPATETQVARALDFCLGATDGSCYLRLTSVPVEVPFHVPDNPLRLGHGEVVVQGDGAVVVFAYGPVTLSQAHAAVRAVADGYGKVATLINLPFLNRVDANWLADVLKDAHTAIAVDNHAVEGGQGAMLGAAIAESGFTTRLQRVGLHDVAPSGTPEEVLAATGLSADAIAHSVKAAFEVWS